MKKASFLILLLVIFSLLVSKDVYTKPQAKKKLRISYKKLEKIAGKEKLISSAVLSICRKVENSDYYYAFIVPEVERHQTMVYFQAKYANGEESNKCGIEKGNIINEVSEQKPIPPLPPLFKNHRLLYMKENINTILRDLYIIFLKMIYMGYVLN